MKKIEIFRLDDGTFEIPDEFKGVFNYYDLIGASEFLKEESLIELSYAGD